MTSELETPQAAPLAAFFCHAFVKQAQEVVFSTLSHWLIYPSSLEVNQLFENGEIDMRTILLSAMSALMSIALFPSLTIAHAAEESASATSQNVSFKGEWTKKSFRSSGEWTIYTEGEKTFVKLSSDFKTRNAPDLKLFLSPHEASTRNGRNATDGAVLIAPLASNSGEQVYEIPASVDLASFKTIMIHCQKFSKLWSVATLA